MRRAVICFATLAVVGCADDIGEGAATDGETEGSGTSSGTAPTATPATSASASTGGSGSTTVPPATDGTSIGETDTDDPTTTGEDAEIEWYPCSFYTDGDGLEAECADIPVPLDWADPGGDQINFFVKRVGGTDGSGQVHLLHGGPGVSGKGYEGFAEQILANAPFMDVYLIDHRGTGRSSRLSCDGEAPTSPDGIIINADRFEPCIAQLEDEWGEGLGQFNTSNAARDLGWLIDELSDLDQEVHVFGGSYGTYWAERYMQLFPDQADGVSMLGVASPGFDFRYWEEDYNSVTESFLALCDDDPACGPRLGPDTVARAHTIMDMVEGGHCAEAGLDRETLQVYFATRMAWFWYDRALIPALLHRLERCSPADVAALQFAAPQMQDPLGAFADPVLSAPLLGTNIVVGEMMKEPIPTEEELAAIHANVIASTGDRSGTPETVALWPGYEPDAYVDAYADSDVPLLMLHGEFDPNAPLDGLHNRALDMAEAFTAPGQRFVVLPGGVHSWDSPMGGGGSCSYNLFYEFLADPVGPLGDCTGFIDPVSFDHDWLAPGFFGTDSLWD